MSRSCRLWIPFFILLLTLSISPAQAGDWIHWRGPEENGVSRELHLPDSFDPATKTNVAWQQPFGGRSAPLVLDGRIYTIQGTGAGLDEHEQVLCFDEATGKKLHDFEFNVFHTDIVSSRLGWTTLTADPATKYVYAHGTGGQLFCLDRDLKLVWQRSLTEEFGRVTGYGGRVTSPIFDSGLCIIGMANSSWGDQSPTRNRFVAFDGKTGQVVWWADTGNPLRGTYYSSPVISVINGQRLLITGGADGYLHAFKVRTGEKVWSIRFGVSVINGSPIVDGTRVYCTHGVGNPGGGAIGKVLCVDAAQIDPKTHQPKVVWQYQKGHRFGLASAALADGRLYAPDDTGELFCFDGKTGNILWTYRYATEVRGSPLIADGKLYIFDVKGRLLIMKLKGNERPDEAETFVYKFRNPQGGLNETNGTPIAVNGRVYFTTHTDLYALQLPSVKPECGKYTPLAAETPFKENAIAEARLFPADVEAKAGEKIAFKVVYLDANGREVKDNRPSPPEKWTLPTPPLPKGAAKGPPPLQGKVEGGTVTLAPLPSQQGYVEFDSGGMKARARVRVVAQIPYKQDFTQVPAGAAPGGWVNTQGKYLVVDQNGNKVLSKVNNNARPPIARANAYITLPTANRYTIQADMLGTEVRGRMPDMGLVNCRYNLILGGAIDPVTKQRQIRFTSWEARPRLHHTVNLSWKPGTWYTVKFEIEQKEKTAVLHGKVWERGQKEPEKWTLEFEDPLPNREGSAALFGYVSNQVENDDGTTTPGSEIFYDNVSITPMKK